MKRRRLLITGVLLLLGGAIVNVAVAWGCIFHIGSDAQIKKRTGNTTLQGTGVKEEARSDNVDLTAERWLLDSGWSAPPSRGTMTFDVFVHQADRRGLHQTAYLLFGHQPIDERRSSLHTFPPNVIVWRIMAGWPRLSLESEIWPSVSRQDRRGPFVYDGDWKRIRTFKIARNDGTKWGLPLRPLWPGFAINTIFYAAMLCVVFFVPGMVRRRIRRRRGRCPACAYPIGTSPVCTECGAAVKQKAETQKAEIG